MKLEATRTITTQVYPPTIHQASPTIHWYPLTLLGGERCTVIVNPLNPNLSILSLHSLLYTFHLVLTRRICLAIKASLVGDHFLYSHDLNE